MPAQLRIGAGWHKTGKLGLPLRGGGRAEIEVDLTKFQGVSVRKCCRESARRTGGRAPRGLRWRCFTEDNRGHAAVDHKEEHGPQGSTEGPDEPASAGPAPGT